VPGRDTNNAFQLVLLYGTCDEGKCYRFRLRLSPRVEPSDRRRCCSPSEICFCSTGSSRPRACDPLT